MELRIVNKVPKEFYTIKVNEVHELFNGPSILHIQGQSDETVFISTLLHGNETTSFLALQKLLKQFEHSKPPKTILAFIGNTLGAKEGLRHLPNQPDYNRIWGPGDSKEHYLATQVFLYAKKFKLFANIDIHNNTGKNPHYACINTLEDQCMHLASLFSKQVVFHTEPSTIQSMAFTPICPSVTLEAGLPGKEEGTKHVLEFLNTILNLDKFELNFDYQKIEVYHTVGRIIVDKDANIDFEENKSTTFDLSFIKNFDELNFTQLESNQFLAFTKNESKLKVIDNQQRDVTSKYFISEDSKLKVIREFIPAMFSKDIYVVKEDCVGYIMEKMFTK